MEKTKNGIKNELKDAEVFEYGKLTKEVLEDSLKKMSEEEMKAFKEKNKNSLKKPMSRKEWKRKKKYRKSAFQGWLHNSFKNNRAKEKAKKEADAKIKKEQLLKNLKSKGEYLKEKGYENSRKKSN